MFIYKITNTVNGKIYIGKTIKSIMKRFNHHIGRAFRHDRNSRLCCAMRKYGREAFTIETIEICSSAEELDTKEIFWISHYDSTKPEIGYNMTAGGDGGHYLNTQGVSMLIAHAKARKGKTHEEIYGIEKAAIIKAAKSESMLGIHIGRVISKETASKISDTLKEKHKDPTFKAKITQINRDIAKTKIGTKRPNLHNQETKNRLSLLRKGKSYEEVYGLEKANIIREKQRAVRYGDKNHIWKVLPIKEIIRELIDDPYINMTILAKKYGCSRPTLAKKLRSVTKIDNLQQFRLEHSKDEIISFFKNLVDGIA